MNCVLDDVYLRGKTLADLFLIEYRCPLDCLQGRIRFLVI